MNDSDSLLLEIIVDADSCPVKDEIYRVAARYGLGVTLVANVPLAIPAAKKSWVKMELVTGKFEAADDWIAENVNDDKIVITADYPLARRSFAAGARVITFRGVALTEEKISDGLAQRDITAQLREIGMPGGGPPPFDNKDRSKFLQTLDQVIQAYRRESQRQA
jgi:uncharacterized protein YaiI (UPF0178 family)